MKIYRYWAKYTTEFPFTDLFNGKTIENKEFTFYGGSNTSADDAFEDAKRQATIIQNRINGEDTFEEYSVPIREEIVTEIDANNIVTRNRYGALVLNSTDILFIDIDEDSFYRLRKRQLFISIFTTKFWLNLFKPKEKKQIQSNKEYILIFLREKLSEYNGRTARIYKTPNGYRVAILNHVPPAHSYEAQQILKDFCSDYLYRDISFKQNCYRARLTPKSWRMGLKRHRVVFPFPTAEEKIAFDDWLKNYDRMRTSYSACTFIEQIGPTIYNSGIEYHDAICKANEYLSMA